MTQPSAADIAEAELLAAAIDLLSEQTHKIVKKKRWVSHGCELNIKEYPQKGVTLDAIRKDCATARPDKNNEGYVLLNGKKQRLHELYTKYATMANYPSDIMTHHQCKNVIEEYDVLVPITPEKENA